MSYAAYARKAYRQYAERQEYTLRRLTSYSVPQYTPVNQKAAGFHASTAKVNILPGGNQSGKTTTVAHDHVMYARNCPDGCRGLALTDTYENVGQNLWQHYKECMHPSEWEWVKGNRKEDNPKIIRRKANNYLFCFGSYEQGRKAQQGKKWNYFHPDEECPPEIWEEVYRGCIAKGARIGYSYTPFDNYEYVEKIIEQGQMPEDNGFWAPQEPMTLLENPHISDEEKRMWIDMLSEKSQKNRIYGYASTSDGLVFPEYNENIHVCDHFKIPDDWKFYRGIDFGYEHPTTSIIMATDGWMFYVVDEYYQNHRLIEDHVAAMQLQHKSISTASGNPPRLLSISDHDKQLRMEYQKKGIITKAAKKDILPGLEVMHNTMKIRSDGATRFKIFRHCKETRREFKKYKKPPVDKHGNLKPGEKGETPLKEWDHCIDPIRYCQVEHFGFFEEQRHRIQIVR